MEQDEVSCTLLGKGTVDGTVPLSRIFIFDLKMVVFGAFWMVVHLKQKLQTTEQSAGFRSEPVRPGPTCIAWVC